MKARPVVGAFLLWVLQSSAIAETADCAGATNERTKHCQVQKRRGYGHDLERSLLRNGLDVKVFVEEAGDPGSGAYPRLVIWTFVANDKPYELNSEAKILEGARRVGFRMIVYVDKGEDNNWYFDLTRPGRAALDVLPWQSPPWKRP
jgi:hypothetical protein